MRASLRYVFRNLARRRLRTAAGVVGIFLTLALLTAIQIGLDSVSTSYTELVALQAGEADLLVGTRAGHRFRPEAFDPAEAQSVLSDRPELRGSAPRWVGIVQVGFAGQEHYALLLGVDPERERELGLWGLRPEPQLSGNVCVVSRALAKRFSVDAGSRLELTGGSGLAATVELEGVVDRQLIVPQEIQEVVIANEAVARTLLGEWGRVHGLAARLRTAAAYYDSRDLQGSLRRLRAVGDAVAVALGPDYEVKLPKAAALMAFHTLASPLRAAFGVFVLLALCVTGLLVYSIVSVGVEERVREFAILRTLGARRGDVFRMVLSESALLCGLGVLPGVLAGGMVARVVLWFVGLALGAGADAVSLTGAPGQAWKMIAVGMVLAVGSALVPAWQATRWAIVDALDPMRRGQIQRPEGEGSGAQRAWLLSGLALSAVSVVVFFVLPTAFLSGDSSLIGTVILGLLLTILLGFTLVAVSGLPAVEVPVMRVLGTVVGPAAELGCRNLQRHRRRNRTTSLMFILSVALVVFVASLVVLFSRTTMTMVQHFNGADLRLQSEDPAAGALGDELLGIEGVEGMSQVRFLRSRTAQGRAYDVVMSDLTGLKQLWLVPFGVDAMLPQVLFTNHIRYAEGGGMGWPRSRGMRRGEP